jgi:hypothetical protein
VRKPYRPTRRQQRCAVPPAVEGVEAGHEDLLRQRVAVRGKEHRLEVSCPWGIIRLLLSESRIRSAQTRRA